MATKKKKIAALISEYRLRSHADVIIGRMLGGYYYKGQHHEPRVEVVSMYTDQVPDMDMSRDLAAKHGFKIYPSIRQALTLTSDHSRGRRQLAIDGVVLICEHGTYPYNALGQKLYPRYEFFKQVVDVFRETGQVVPVFQDKHLSYDWHKAKWMANQAKDLDFPLMAGSVLPLAHHPDLRWEFGKPIDKAVWTWEASFVGNKDSYGFHALEELQSRVERRAGGETGIDAVQCLEGDPVWQWTDERPWAKKLLGTVAPELRRESVKDPMLFALEYFDGLETAIYRLNGHRSSSRFAALVPGGRDPVVLPTASDTPSPVALPEELRDRYPVANHFSAEVYLIEEMILTGRIPNPVERTLLTTGALVELFESSYQRAPNYGATYQHGQVLEEGHRIETPHLHIHYQIDDDAQ